MAAYYNEFDPKAAAWLRELIKAGLIAKGEVDERSILDVRPDELRGFTQCHFFAGIGGWSYALRLAGWPDAQPVWTGSPPCQPFSAAGAGLGRDDARHLAPHFISLVGACRPAVLFGEQVASADVFGKTAKSVGEVVKFSDRWEADRVAGVPREKRRGQQVGRWAWFDDLSDRLEAAHYAVGASDIPAAGVGAPHFRQRTFFGAINLADGAGVGRGEGRSDASRGNERSEAQGRAAGFKHGRLHGVLADPCGSGLQGGERQGQTGEEGASGGYGPERGGAGGADAPDGFWGTADWLFCRDGKWRPVEPGTFPLAHGIPARVGRLRGYGNAIVPQAAAEFIGGMMEAIQEMEEAA